MNGRLAGVICSSGYEMRCSRSSFSSPKCRRIFEADSEVYLVSVRAASLTDNEGSTSPNPGIDGFARSFSPEPPIDWGGIPPELAGVPEGGPEELNPDPEELNPVPEELNPGPEELNPGPEELNPGPEELNPGPEELNPVPEELNPVPGELNPASVGPTALMLGLAQRQSGVHHHATGNPRQRNPAAAHARLECVGAVSTDDPDANGLMLRFRTLSVHVDRAQYGLGQAILCDVTLQIRRQLHGQRTYFFPTGAFFIGYGETGEGHGKNRGISET
ncbi:Zinc finger protein 358 [Liparis tanakae]|uniref:Zinc finger protein 358 n=1 Tax=Liparis tanakae TaxID=230148 RepID=A0A4Z2GJL0_9TELE|nr:Zinc finger protein 358 [Liparis tanakae]